MPLSRRRLEVIASVSREVPIQNMFLYGGRLHTFTPGQEHLDILSMEDGLDVVGSVPLQTAEPIVGFALDRHSGVPFTATAAGVYATVELNTGMLHPITKPPEDGVLYVTSKKGAYFVKVSQPHRVYEIRSGKAVLLDTALPGSPYPGELLQPTVSHDGELLLYYCDQKLFFRLSQGEFIPLGFGHGFIGRINGLHYWPELGLYIGGDTRPTHDQATRYHLFDHRMAPAGHLVTPPEQPGALFDAAGDTLCQADPTLTVLTAYRLRSGKPYEDEAVPIAPR